MKIYPSDHEIKQVEAPKLFDIPVAHIENGIMPDTIEILPYEDFVLDTEKILNPYDSVSDDTLLFFNENGQKITPAFKRENNNFIYQPENTTEFSPDEFDVAAVIKKNLSYDSSKIYNIQIGVNELNNNLAWSKELITIFGSAGTRQLCPANIVINDQSGQPSSLVLDDYTKADFLFVKTLDGKAFTQSLSSYLDVDTILRSYTNLWLTMSNTSDAFLTPNAPASYRYVNPQIYNQAFSATSTICVNEDYEFPYYPKSIYTYHHWFIGTEPFYIIERPSRGFIIISTESIFKNLQTNAKLIYETLFQVYAKTYLKTNYEHSWITNEAVDFLGSSSNRLKRKHKAINLSSMIEKSSFGCQMESNDYALHTLDIDSAAAVIYDEADTNANLFFRKLLQTDPVKPQNEISLYTSKGTIIYYKNAVIKQIESKIRCKVSIEEDESCVNNYIYTVTILPLKSSKHKIYTSTEKTFHIQYPERLHYLVATATTQESDEESTLLLLDEYAYSPASGMAIAEIHVAYESIPVAADVRQLGGGAPPEKQYDNYELLDIGSLKGRPYRIGTSMIIKLPKRLEKYDEYIAKAIDRRKIAADLAIIKYV